MVKRNYYLILFLVLCFGIMLSYIFQYTVDLYRWQYADWVINYQSGFVRRGLPGEVIYQFSILFNQNIQISFFIVLSCITFLFYFLNYLYFKNLKFNLIYILLFISPWFFLFSIYDQKIGIRKEVLFYIFFLWLLLDLKTFGYQSDRFWKFIAVFPLLLLSHEGIFFFAGYIISSIIIFVDKKNKNKIFFQIFILLVISIFIELIIYNFKGNENSVDLICKSLSVYKPDNCENVGAIWALKEGTEGFALFLGSHDLKGYLTFLFSFIYGFFPIFLFFLFNIANFKNRNLINNKIKFFFIFIFPFLFCFLLFIIANDWGRWFSANYFLIFYLIIHLINHKFIFINKKSFFSNKFFDLNKAKKISCIIIFFLYSTFVVLPNYYVTGEAGDEGLKIQYLKIYKNVYKGIKKH